MITLVGLIVVLWVCRRVLIRLCLSIAPFIIGIVIGWRLVRRS